MLIFKEKRNRIRADSDSGIYSLGSRSSTRASTRDVNKIEFDENLLIQPESVTTISDLESDRFVKGHQTNAFQMEDKTYLKHRWKENLIADIEYGLYHQHVSQDYESRCLSRKVIKDIPKERSKSMEPMLLRSYGSKVSNQRLSSICSNHRLPRLSSSKPSTPSLRKKINQATKHPHYSSDPNMCNALLMLKNQVVHRYIASRGQRERETEVYEVLPHRILLRHCRGVSVC